MLNFADARSVCMHIFACFLHIVLAFSHVAEHSDAVKK